MAYTNSPLVNYTKLSPNHSGLRNHAIDTITIHCVVGQCSVETIGNVFAPVSRQASSNYGIGPDGRVGMYVEEKNRSWCTSSAYNDHRAITIEVASDTTEPYAVKDAAYNALINLVADICKRNGIKKLVWSANKNDRVNHLNGCNMTVHRDYANKSCPGTFLYERHGDIAAKVNAKLGQPGNASSSTQTDVKYRVRKSANDAASQIGAFVDINNAKALADKNSGYKVFDMSGNLVYPTPEPTLAPQPAKKTVAQLADEVIQGKWGNGQDRKDRLTAAGYNYTEVQNAVNAKLSGNSAAKPNRKSNEQIADEVIRGDWGNGADRKRKLTEAGYDYSIIQSIVNRKLS